MSTGGKLTTLEFSRLVRRIMQAKEYSRETMVKASDPAAFHWSGRVSAFAEVLGWIENTDEL